jgi:hypothetical protein
MIHLEKAKSSEDGAFDFEASDFGAAVATDSHILIIP